VDPEQMMFILDVERHLRIDARREQKIAGDRRS
jgi:hypothetical protein